jgi:hypothetical protein
MLYALHWEKVPRDSSSPKTKHITLQIRDFFEYITELTIWTAIKTYIKHISYKDLQYCQKKPAEITISCHSRQTARFWLFYLSKHQKRDEHRNVAYAKGGQRADVHI